MDQNAPVGDGDVSVGSWATLACVMEATAPKPGNVHRGADFEDLSFFDFLVSAMAIRPVMDAAPHSRLGETVLRSVEATRRTVARNTNLGTILLLAPLASVPTDAPLRAGVGERLADCTPDDARDVYEAIRLAQPGGMGHVDEADLAGPAPPDLIAAMRLAADRDLVARQYARGFADVFESVAPWLSEAVAAEARLADAIVATHLRVMSVFPDSLIARKCGAEVAHEAALRAAAVLAQREEGSAAYQRALADLDFWLRSDHHRRNPGTTADMIAGGLFVALREGIIKAPYAFF